jgi:AmmeMemoRadiSam system protein B
MPDTQRPQLRPYLALARLDPFLAQGKEFVLYDRLRLSSAQLLMSAAELECLRLFDGRRTLLEIQLEVIRLFGGQIVPLEVFAGLAERLDRALFLDSPRFREAAGTPVRRPSCLGVYEADPPALRRQMAELFRHPQASGPPGEAGKGGRLRAMLAPHIDYHRGGPAYTFAFKELFENTPASLFVIIGTSHYCPWKRFTLTRKHFQTPLGVVPTDHAYIDRLVSHYGDGLFDEEWVAHLPEHSIELEVVFLHYLYEGKRDIRIVPLVVGSFEDCTQTGESPSGREDVCRMVEALRAAERETPEPICYVISGDLAHIGPKFGALEPVRDRQLGHSRSQDMALMVQAEKADADGYFRVIAQERDERNICGLPPTWLTLAAARPSRGRLLRYEQYVEPSGHESVSFASVAFYE